MVEDVEVEDKEECATALVENTEKWENETKRQKDDFSSKMLRVVKTSSVEPILMLNMMSVALVQVISQSWLLRLACEEMTESTCPPNEHSHLNGTSCVVECNQRDTQAELQKTVAEVQAWRSAIEFSFPLILVPFLGAWSDARKERRRKPVMLFALSGRIMQLILVIALLLMPKSPSLTVAGLCLAIPVSVTASSMAVDMAAYSYISDTTAEKMRTVRLGLANAFWCLGSVLGLLLSGILFQQGGEILVFGTGLVLELLAVLVSVWKIKSLDEDPEEKERKATSWRLLLEPLSVAVARRKGKARLLILLLLANLFLAFGASCGRQTVMFLYTRLRFEWDEVEYGLYGTFLMLMEVIGSVIAMALFSHKMKLPDAIVGLMSCVSQVLSSTFYTFANSTLGMYIAPLVEIANGQVVVLPRAMVTKLTEPHEQGKVHALFGCVEAVVPLVFEPLYNNIYAATLDTFPQTVFWVSAGLTWPPTIMFVWLQWGRGKKWLDGAKTIEQETCTGN